MLFLQFAVFQDFKSFCLGMKSRNKMGTKNCSGMAFLNKNFFFWNIIHEQKDPSTRLPYCAHGM